MQLEHDRRISRATELMAAEGLDALVLSTSNKSQSIFYLTGLDRLCANLVLLRNGRNTLLILDQDLLDAKDTAHADNIRTYPSTIAQFKAIAETMEECGLKDGSVGVETSFLRATFYDSLKAALPAAITITDATKVTGQLRLIKTQYEIDLIRKASAIAVKALESTTDLIRSGISENEIAATTEYELRKAGAEETAMSTFISSGPRTSAAHPPASNRKLVKGDPVLIDLHPRIQGYCSDLAATFTTPPAETKFSKQIRQILEARNAAIQDLRNGDPFSKLHQNYLKRLGKSDFIIPAMPFFNNLHGVGTSANDPPSFWYPVDVKIQPGMVFALAQSPIRPKQPSEIGIKFEDTYLITEVGVERLTPFKYPQA